MGNRANVLFVAGYDKPDYGYDRPSTWEVGRVSPTIYLHWNGGPESVYAFLAELDSRDVRADADYEAARFVQIVGEFFDSDYRNGLSLGIVNTPTMHTVTGGNLDRIPTDNTDNGFFVVSRAAKDIVHRVRRFTLASFVREDTDGEYHNVRRLLTEWDKAQVDEEYRKALRNSTYLGLREFFDETRGFTTYNEYRESIEKAG